ncbi:glycine oxidase ThiO [Arthrobacter castelli]|uniref:glycine oxidase ThiO n=1 Tax=Arthrobacter castelli TaxID=271431 RepID=UPI0003FDBE6B|nr:glycine oxidase ThiO [Arthrobacter castelli]
MAQYPGRHAIVVGGGIIGLAIAWEAARRGHRITLVDPDPAGGATHAAAGMLAPVSELHYREEHLLDLTLASAQLYPDFVDRLTAAAGQPVGYQQTGTMVAAVDAADRQSLSDLHQAQTRLGLQSERLTTRSARRMEPMLGPQLTGAFLASADHQVDPRAMAAALQTALAGRPDYHRLTARATGVLSMGGCVTGVRLEDGTTVTADEVVLANGLSAAGMDGLPDGLSLPLRPVYGDILRLNVPQALRPLLTRTVRAVVCGRQVYVVPRADGTVVIGATQRENGSAGVSAGGVYELLRDAQTVIPAVAELELQETICRPRPGTADNAPLLGRCRGQDGQDVAGLLLATGFFRHGVLLAPLAARLCAELIDGAKPFMDVERYRPDRFVEEGAL